MNEQPGTTVTVIVPVYRGGEAFEQCLASLVRADPPADRILVVADGGLESDRNTAAAFGLDVLTTPAPGGPGGARNLGARHADTDLLFFVDADVTVQGDALGRVRQVFTAHPDVDAVFGSYDDEPAAPNFLSQYKNLLHHHVHMQSREEASTFWGACGAVRREVFLESGGFDARRYRRPRIEDIELGYRWTRAGRKIRLLKDLRVKHLKRWTARSLLEADIFGRALPWTRLILAGEPAGDDLNLDRASQASVVCVFLLGPALAASVFQPWLLGIAVMLAGSLLWLNRRVYRFFRQKRGVWFTVRVIPWHWFYYLYGGLAFLAGTAEHWLRRVRGVPAEPGPGRLTPVTASEVLSADTPDAPAHDQAAFTAAERAEP